LLQDVTLLFSSRALKGLTFNPSVFRIGPTSGQLSYFAFVRGGPSFDNFLLEGCSSSKPLLSFSVIIVSSFTLSGFLIPKATPVQKTTRRKTSNAKDDVVVHEISKSGIHASGEAERGFLKFGTREASKAAGMIESAL
jgi:hypothetical protein